MLPLFDNATDCRSSAFALSNADKSLPDRLAVFSDAFVPSRYVVCQSVEQFITRHDRHASCCAIASSMCRLGSPLFKALCSVVMF